MTRYSYYDRLRELSLRAVKALQITEKENPTLIHFYEAAEEGFFRKQENMKLSEATKKITDAEFQTLGKQIDFVMQKEYEAALAQKEVQNELK